MERCASTSIISRTNSTYLAHMRLCKSTLNNKRDYTTKFIYLPTQFVI